MSSRIFSLGDLAHSFSRIYDAVNPPFDAERREFLFDEVPKSTLKGIAIAGVAQETLAEGLERIAIELELKDPETKEIIRLFNEKEFREIEREVYQPLLKESPSLKYLIDNGGGISGISDSLEGYRQTLSIYKDLSASLKLIEESHQFPENMRKNAFIARFQIVDRLIGDIQDLYQLEAKFYAEFSRAVKEIAFSNNISYSEFMGNNLYIYSAIKKVFPTRKNAEAFDRNLRLSLMSILERSRQLSSLPDKIGIPLQDDIKMPIPSQIEIERLFQAEGEYRNKQLDRIYSTK